MPSTTYLIPSKMNTTLAPHRSMIQLFISLPHLEDIQRLPDGRHLQQHKIKASSTGGYTIKYCGNLTAVQQAQVAHWIYDDIEEAKETVMQFITLAYNKRSILEADPNYLRDGSAESQDEFLLEAAWTVLSKETGSSTDMIHTDVDIECLSIFEQRLSENSAQSGSAGNY
ncbi:hypothetical protein BDR07DRAFT_1611292 [Suillus spraguei]|nr:hypothetical protein BDR07DRAFT_1611292 [Suillus spraguei]